MTSPSPEQRQAARDFFAGQIQPTTANAREALVGLWADGYSGGALATAQQIPGAALVASLSGVYGDATSAWSKWEPGNIDAALLLDDGGFGRLLDAADLTIDGITGTLLDRMGSLLAEGALNGDSVDTIARSLMDVLDDPERAYTIADTELARAVNAASMGMYAENGVSEWTWLDSPGACPSCVDNAANGPYATGEGPTLPAHPRCRCSSAPLDPGLS